MNYISVKEASQKWGISERRVRALCESGRIEGATRCGDWVWSIPSTTVRPADGRTLRYIRNMSLRTGSQDYKSVSSLKKASYATLKEESIIQTIQTIFAFEGKEVSIDDIKTVIKLGAVSLPLKDQIEILNLKSALSNLGFEISEQSLCNLNKRLCLNINEKNGGKYNVSDNQAQMAEALMIQYSGSWSVLHPIARTAFLFTELLRIDLFQLANEQTAFVVLANEIAKAKLPPAIFGPDYVTELKAALASCKMRGNAQALVSMIVNAISRQASAKASQESKKL